jgi:hypothetical protein
MYDRGVVRMAYSRGLLSFGGGGEEGGEEDANVMHATTTNSFPLPPGLDAIERKLERIVKDSLSSFVFVLLENYPRCTMQIIVR